MNSSVVSKETRQGSFASTNNRRRNEDNLVNIEKNNEPRLIVVNEIAPIDEGYSWVICACCFVLNATTWGMNSGFSIYLSHFINYDTFPGMTKVDYAYIGGIAFGAGISFSPLLIVLYDQIGIKAMIALGNCIQFTALMLASFSTNKWQIYCSQGLLQSFGLAAISIPFMTLIPQYFVKHRVLASSIATAGSGLGGIIFNLGMQKIVHQKSVFWAIRVQAIIAFGLISIVIVFIRSKTPRKTSTTKLFDDLIVYKQLDFYIFGLFLITCVFGYVIVLYTLAKYTTSLGYTDYQGSIVSAMIQLGSLLGRPIIGQCSDRFGAVTVTGLCYFICGILCLAMWLPARSLGVVIVFALLEGAMMGSVFGMISPVLQRIYGAKKMISIFSKLWSIFGIAAIFSPVIGIKLTSDNVAEVDPTAFVYCSIFAGCCYIGAAFFLLMLRGHINAREHIIYKMNQESNDDMISMNTHMSISLFKIANYCFRPPIKVNIERTISIKDDTDDTVEHTIHEYKSVVL